MKKIEAAKFEEQCLELLDDLDTDGLIITRDGVPVARVLPYVCDDGDLIGSLRNELEVKGDVFTTGCLWEANTMDEGPREQG